ncbi:MAG: hypothetical protein FWB91_02135 [Defluviitaleaceae bacterium]|nr:hypothetical protein [Defluviitaleaceae bacterium]
MRPKPKTVQYKPIIGAFRKIPRDTARKLILSDYDRSPMAGSLMFTQSLNARLKGATVEEFLKEREDADRWNRLAERRSVKC